MHGVGQEIKITTIAGSKVLDIWPSNVLECAGHMLDESKGVSIKLRRLDAISGAFANSIHSEIHQQNTCLCSVGRQSTLKLINISPWCFLCCSYSGPELVRRATNSWGYLTKDPGYCNKDTGQCHTFPVIIGERHLES